jgi:hypothetical protein
VSARSAERPGIPGLLWLLSVVGQLRAMTEVRHATFPGLLVEAGVHARGLYPRVLWRANPCAYVARDRDSHYARLRSVRGTASVASAEASITAAVLLVYSTVVGTTAG